MLLNELRKFKLKKELITLRRDCGDDDITGEVIDVNENYVVFILWTDDGLYDGTTVFEIDQINEVLWGNREHESIKLLVEKFGKRPVFEFESIEFEKVVLEAFSKYKHLSIYHEHGEDSFDICSLDEVDEYWLKILTYGPMKTLSRLGKIIKSENILRFTIDSPYQNNIVSLHSHEL
ncbi:hypothetical protein [Teredinibacter sp. KSP-S5-2]|uniref:hypothetical protein n=1 Tax=Teredinibacter sp. KSP-S5-2 TaxID=3034506 RepID=UPI00293446F3|nr:hypothetical protein [Teredinibacter sp. KSP-S5-2]WNO09145.1 hypothetical protein P5V12_19575 [Teredinibacter sp. KSP-S5-2]